MPPIVFMQLSCASDQTGETRAYYVLLQKTLPEVGLYLTSVRYDSSVFPPQGRWGLSTFTRRLLLLLLRTSRGASATGARAALYAGARDASLAPYKEGGRHSRRPRGTTAALDRVSLVQRLPQDGRRDLCKARVRRGLSKKVECRSLGELVNCIGVHRR
jgi:hypothetical protein